MKAPSEFTRLTETGDPRDLELVAAIRALRAERASPLAIAGLADRLAPQLAAPAVAPAARLFSASSKWLVSILFTFGLSLFATLHFGRSEPPPVVSSVPRATTPPPVVVPRVEPAPLPAAIEPTVEEVVQPAAPRPPRARSQPKPAPQPLLPAAADSSGSAEAELQLLGRAQRALDVAPRTALTLTEEHAATYPRGLFVQEREMLAIQALLKLRQRRAALARAQDFLSHYPTSPHARHLRPLLENGE